ncbi:pyroglutamyl-peptidase I family protein [Halomarina oriensis]|uniref:Peptidase n=1 Tax=Halomarina oriensis TaxID=671145 RepID=A0A6B0GEW1_9EURY|nr:peptidase [Halomarina oriensis]MWG33352.1 peptidase [Halomarina oriensis]
MSVLLTGYEPFGEFEENPSEQLARRLDGEDVAGHELVGSVLPVEFDGIGERLATLVDRHDPAAVVCTGLASGEPAIRLERVGVNVADAAGTPDNADADPVDERIAPDGADAYLSTLPLVRTVEHLRERGVPARVSNTAGTHLCNDALYSTLAHLDATGRDVPAGFVHLPATPAIAVRNAEHPERGGSVPASMDLDLQAEAVRQVVAAALVTV